MGAKNNKKASTENIVLFYWILALITILILTFVGAVLLREA